MALVIEQRDSVPNMSNAARNIIAPSFNGTNRIHVSGIVTGAAIGGCLQLFGSNTNDGAYSIYNVAGPSIFDVLPLPNTDGSPSGWVRLCAGAEQKGGSDAITATTATRITAPTATFQTDGVQKNDRAVIDGGTNAGAWFVTAVPGQTQVDVQPLNGGAAMTPGGSVGNNVVIRQGHHQVRVVDHGSDATWSDVVASGVMSTQQVSARGMAAGVLSDYIQTEQIGSSRLSIRTEGIGSIALVNTLAGQADDFLSTDEVVINANTKGRAFVNREDPNGVAGRAEFRVGTRSGGDRYSASDGSAWINWRLQPWTSVGNTSPVEDTTFANKIYGSYFDAPLPSTHGPIGGEYIGSILRDGMIANYQTVAEDMIVESVIHYHGAFPIADPGYESANVLLSSASTGNITYSGTPDILLPVEGILKSDLTAPLYQVARLGGGALTLDLLNPRADYTMAELVSAVTGGAVAQLRYTYNPRFVERHSVGIGVIPTTIANLVVRIWAVVPGFFELEHPGSPFTTAASGRIEGYEPDGRDGVNLTRWYSTGTPLGLQMRVTIEGTGYRFVNQSFTMTTRFDGDYPVDFMAPDLEEDSFST
jgi:hypothetical protein